MISLSTHPTLVHQLMAMIAFAEKSHITLTEYPIEITCHRQMFNQMDSQRFLLLVIKEKELLLVANGQNETSARIHVPSVALSYHRVDSKTCSTPYDTPKSTTYALHAMYNASPQSQYRESA